MHARTHAHIQTCASKHTHTPQLTFTVQCPGSAHGTDEVPRRLSGTPAPKWELRGQMIRPEEEESRMRVQSGNICAQHLCATFVCNICVQHLCATFVCNICVQHLCATFVCNICVQSGNICAQHLCATFVCKMATFVRNICAQHLCATFVCNICVQRGNICVQSGNICVQCCNICAQHLCATFVCNVATLVHNICAQHLCATFMRRIHVQSGNICAQFGWIWIFAFILDTKTYTIRTGPILQPSWISIDSSFLVVEEFRTLGTKVAPFRSLLWRVLQTVETTF